MRRDNPRYHSNCRICGLSEALTLPHGEGLITDGRLSSSRFGGYGQRALLPAFTCRRLSEKTVSPLSPSQSLLRDFSTKK